jgi:hypothetical protein
MTSVYEVVSLSLIYEEESVNRSQINIKRKTYGIQTWEQIFISSHNIHQHRYTCPITLPAHQNLQLRSLLTVVSATSAPGWASPATFERP